MYIYACVCVQWRSHLSPDLSLTHDVALISQEAESLQDLPAIPLDAGHWQVAPRRGAVLLDHMTCSKDASPWIRQAITVVAEWWVWPTLWASSVDEVTERAVGKELPHYHHTHSIEGGRHRWHYVWVLGGGGGGGD